MNLQPLGFSRICHVFFQHWLKFSFIRLPVNSSLTAPANKNTSHSMMLPTPCFSLRCVFRVYNIAYNQSSHSALSSWKHFDSNQNDKYISIQVKTEVVIQMSLTDLAAESGSKESQDGWRDGGCSGDHESDSAAQAHLWRLNSRGSVNVSKNVTLICWSRRLH